MLNSLLLQELDLLRISERDVVIYKVMISLETLYMQNPFTMAKVFLTRVLLLEYDDITCEKLKTRLRAENLCDLEPLSALDLKLNVVSRE